MYLLSKHFDTQLDTLGKLELLRS